MLTSGGAAAAADDPPPFFHVLPAPGESSFDIAVGADGGAADAGATFDSLLTARTPAAARGVAAAILAAADDGVGAPVAPMALYAPGVSQSALVNLLGLPLL